MRELRAIAALDADARSADEARESKLDAERMRGALAHCLAELPTEEADVLYLLVWAELDQPEIAAALDVPLGTVKSRLSRARKRVREALDLPADLPTNDLSDDPEVTDADPDRRHHRDEGLQRGAGHRAARGPRRDLGRDGGAHGRCANEARAFGEAVAGSAPPPHRAAAPLGRRARRRRLGLAFAGATFAAAVVAGALVLSSGPTAQPAGAAEILHQAADAAAELPATSVPGPGQFLYRKEQRIDVQGGEARCRSPAPTSRAARSAGRCTGRTPTTRWSR